jgi:hypothetical protein
LLATLLLALSLGACASNRTQDVSLKQSAKEVGQEVGVAARKVGQQAKKIGKTVADAAKQGGQAVKQAVKGS